jgi:deoxyribodipyrimidine photo-lyase
MTPDDRILARNDAPLHPDRDYVLYWMIAARRTTHSFALDRALEHARALGKPLLVFEPLRRSYPHASERLHRFVVQGMAANRGRLQAAGVRYHPWVEPTDGDGSGLIEALAARAAVVVTDHWPCLFLPRMVRAAAARLDVRLEAIDGNGLLPLSTVERDFTRAHSFRRHLHKALPPHLHHFPAADPLAGYDLGRATLPPTVQARWPAADALLDDPSATSELGLGGPAPVALEGGSEAGGAVLRTFVGERLDAYGEGRSHPDEDASSGLSPWLHFGHVGAHQVAAAVLDRASWSPDDLGAPSGSREGWWGLPQGPEAFLDELVTWRELGHVLTHRRDDYDRYEGLPEWARTTLEEHAGDRRPQLYDLETFEAAATHDDVWNAAQRQLVGEGRIHNYLRMLWGKKILHWTASPQEALSVMLTLNDRYAVDGRDPNSYSGIGWVLGRFDRAWGPEREVFGKIRYMTSDSTRRKLKLKGYLARWGPSAG